MCTVAYNDVNMDCAFLAINARESLNNCTYMTKHVLVANVYMELPKEH